MPHAAVPLALVLLAFASPVPDGARPAENTFDRTVAPILVERCLSCHAGDEPKGRLNLTTRQSALRGGASGVVIVPGKPEESLLWDHIKSDMMPPRSPLSAPEKSALRAWIAAGAEWGSGPLDAFRFSTATRAGRDWWSFQPVRRPAPPEIARAHDARNPIDLFIQRKLAASGLAPSGPADRRTLARRVTFDLLGLPPTPQEVEDFLNDPRPDAYERLVDRLLASPQYGVRWARLWLDLARYGESNGFEHDEFRPDAWRYRDWVVQALNADMPYDEFARLQLAGDVLRPNDPNAIEATGFLVAGAYDSVGQNQQSAAMRRVVREDEMEDIVGTVGQAFLGLTIHCARCHDHKFDPIRQVEYYRLTASLAGVRHGVRDLSHLDPDIQAARARMAAFSARLAVIEGPARARLRADLPTAAGPPPVPIAAWDFDQGIEDQAGNLPVTLQGDARQDADGVHVDGKTAFLATAPLTRDLKAKTLEAWVQLDNLEQRGGGVMSVQALGGGTFDAIVFGEREPGRWMAGSENFARTQTFEGPEETEAHRRPVHLAITYDDDGTIRAYREGQPWGIPYQVPALPTFRAGQAQIVFGLRHAPTGGNRMLAGRIVRARLHDRALSPAEVAASAESGAPLPSERIDALLTEDQQAERRRLRAEIAAARTALADRRRLAYAVTPRPAEPIHRLLRGNPAQPAELVAAGGVEALAGIDADFELPPDAPEAERRTRLAAWITAPRNPLFARVLVNRLWQAHFGVGLVETPSDFGFNGGKPSHPELLDWLAAALIEHGWSLKRIHRLIVTSATYRQSSRAQPDGLRLDAGNRLLWRKAPLRLEAEMVRDALLAVSGALDPHLGGPGFREFTVSRAVGTVTNRYLPAEQVGPEFDRRTLYRSWARGGRNGFLDAFDCPDPSTTTPRRASTTTPLQALALLNNALVLRLADRFADRLRRDAGDDPRRQVDRAYLLAFGRAPDPAEREQALRVTAEFGPAVLARAIFNSNEFLYVD